MACSPSLPPELQPKKHPATNTAVTDATTPVSVLLATIGGILGRRGKRLPGYAWDRHRCMPPSHPGYRTKPSASPTPRSSPWASSYETRTWTTDYRGPLLIHAAASFDTLGLAYLELGGHPPPFKVGE